MTTEQNLTTTGIARRALGLKCEGTPSVAKTRCVCCGANIAIGDNSTPFSPSGSFMDGRQLLHHVRGESGPRLCEDCSPFFVKSPMMKVQRAIITTEGVYPIGKGENRAWFILNPPKPPFSVVFSDAKLQHLLWRTPVTQCSDHWLVQLGPRTLRMNRLRVLEAVKVCERIGAVNLAKKKKQLRSPFLSLDPELGEPRTGTIRPDVRRLANEESLKSEIAFLESLGTGDLWGICAVLFRGGVAALPNPIEISAASSDDDEAETE